MISTSTFRQLRCIASTYSLAFVEGLAVGWPSSATQQLLSEDSPIPITRDAVIWLGTVQGCGRLACVFMFGLFFENRSKTKLLLISTFLQFVGWMITTTASSLPAILLSQFMLGAGMVMFEAIAYNYVAEVSSPRIRGISTAALVFMYALGTEITFVLALFKSYTLLCAIPCFFTVVALLLLYFSLESPYHLIMIGREDEATKNICTLNPDLTTSQVIARFQELQKYTEEAKADPTSLVQLLKSATNLRLCSFLFFINAIAYSNGIQSFTTYGPIIVKPYSNELNADVVMNLMGLTALIGAMLSPMVMDTCGRRFLLLFGFGSLAVFQSGESILFYIETTWENRIPVLPSIIVVLNLLSLAVYQCTLLPITRVLGAEMFPYALKMRASCIVTICRTGTGTVFLALFFPVASILGIGFNFLLYAILAFIATLVSYWYYVETKGLTLMEIQTRYGT